MTKAKVFWSGRSQAIRLPRAFRFDADEVRITRQGRAVLIEPIERGWAWLDDLPGAIDPDFAAAAETDLAEQDRPERAHFT